LRCDRHQSIQSRAFVKTLPARVNIGAFYRTNEIKLQTKCVLGGVLSAALIEHDLERISRYPMTGFPSSHCFHSGEVAYTRFIMSRTTTSTDLEYIYTTLRFSQGERIISAQISYQSNMVRLSGFPQLVNSGTSYNITQATRATSILCRTLRHLRRITKQGNSQQAAIRSLI
jgi:hypothetical protein